MEKQSTTPLAKITLADGKERTLIYTYSAIKALRAEFGVSVTLEGTQKLFQALDENKLAKLLMIGLQHEYPGAWPDVTESDLDKVLTGQNQLAALQQIDTALGFALIKNALELIALLPGAQLPILMATLKAQQAKKVEAPAAAPSLQPTALM